MEINTISLRLTKDSLSLGELQVDLLRSYPITRLD